MAKNYSWETIKFKAKEGWYKACDSARKAHTFLKENPEARNALIAIGVSIGTGVVRGSVKAHKHKQEIAEQEDHIWDPRAGVYYRLRKPLTAAQKLEYTTRYSNKENGAEILKDMGVKFY